MEIEKKKRGRKPGQVTAKTLYKICGYTFKKDEHCFILVTPKNKNTYWSSLEGAFIYLLEEKIPFIEKKSLRVFIEEIREVKRELVEELKKVVK